MTARNMKSNERLTSKIRIIEENKSTKDLRKKTLLEKIELIKVENWNENIVITE